MTAVCSVGEKQDILQFSFEAVDDIGNKPSAPPASKSICARQHETHLEKTSKTVSFSHSRTWDMPGTSPGLGACSTSASEALFTTFSSSSPPLFYHTGESEGSRKPTTPPNNDSVGGASFHTRRDWYSTISTFAAGGVAGAVSRTITAPLDRVKIILQEGHLIQVPANTTVTGRRNTRLINVARMIKADGGWKAFWRGNLINCLKAGPEFAIVFSLRRYFYSVYEDCLEDEKQLINIATRQAEKNQIGKEVYVKMQNGKDPSANTIDGPCYTEEDCVDLTHEMECCHQHAMACCRREIEKEASIFISSFNRLCYISHIPRLLINCAIGACAGLGAQSLLYPIEVLKTRVCVTKNSEFKNGVLQMVKEAYSHGGVREFYRGFTANMIGIIIYRGLEMGLYSSAQQSLMTYRVQWKGLSRRDAALSAAEIGLVGMFASVVSQTVSYPFNVARTRLQTQGNNGRERHYNGTLDCLIKIVKRKGVASLFSGLMANYLKAVPASTATFIVFEKMQQLLLVDD